MSTIQKEWGYFEEAVMPKDASEMQRKQMRRSFFAGMQAMQVLIEGICDLSDDAGITKMQEWQDELHQFAQDVKARRA